MSAKSTIQNFISTAILQIGNYVLPMITLPIISRIIGPEKYGAVNFAFAFVGYFTLVINAGFDLYGTRKVVACKHDKEALSKVFSSITLAKGLMLLFTTVLFLIALFTIEQIKTEMLVNLFTYLLCVGWVINPSWMYNGMQESRRYAVFSFISKLLFSVAVVIAVQQPSDYIYHPLITGLSHVLVSAFSFYYAIRKYQLRFLFVSFKNVIQTIKENKTLALSWWLSNQSSSTNILVAGFFMVSLEIGLYAAAVRIIMIIQSVISMPLNTVLFPYIGHAFAEQFNAGMEKVNTVFMYLLLIGISVTAGTIILSHLLIYAFFGDAFAQAVTLLKLMAPVLFFSTLNTAIGQQVLLHLKKDVVYVKFIASGFFLTILLMIVFTRFFGMQGAAFAWTLSELMIFIAYLVYLRSQQIIVFRYAYFRPAFIIHNSMGIITQFVPRLSRFKK